MSDPTPLVVPRGFRASAVKAGIKPSGGLDLAILAADGPCAAAGTFTTNRVCAAPVRWCRDNLPAADVRSKALDIPYGARIEIHTQAREKFTGLLRGVAEEGITLEQTVNQQLTLRAIPFSEIRSLKYPRNGLHPAAVAALTIGALWGVGALLGGG